MSRPEVFTSATEAEKEGALPKPCLLCSSFNTKTARKCWGCGNKLRTIGEVRADYTERESLMAVFKPKPRRINRKLFDLIAYVDEHGKLQSKKVVLNPQTMSGLVDGEEEDVDESE